ncbi:hypothetical protein Tco_0072816, partial [Tanacetum coccineum]
YNNPTSFKAFKEHSEIVIDFNDDSTSSDDDSPYGEDIDYVDASPLDAEIVSLEEVEIVVLEVGEIEDDVLREKLSKINLLIATIEAMNSNLPPSFDVMTKSSSTSLNLFLEETNTFDNSLTESETFCFDLEENSSGSTTTLSDYSLPDYEAFYLDDDHIEEKSSGSTTTHADFSQYDSELAHIISPSEYDHFYFKIEPEMGNLTMDVVEDIIDNPTREPRVHVPNVLPAHPTLHLDSDFTISMIDTLLPFSSENENKVVNTGILASEEKSTPSSSHWGFKASKLSHHKSPMLIHGDNTPNLGVPLLLSVFGVLCLLSRSGLDSKASHAHICPSITRASILSLFLRIQYPNLID